VLALVSCAENRQVNNVEAGIVGEDLWVVLVV